MCRFPAQAEAKSRLVFPVTSSRGLAVTQSDRGLGAMTSACGSHICKTQITRVRIPAIAAFAPCTCCSQLTSHNTACFALWGGEGGQCLQGCKCALMLLLLLQAVPLPLVRPLIHADSVSCWARRHAPPYALLCLAFCSRCPLPPSAQRALAHATAAALHVRPGGSSCALLSTVSPLPCLVALLFFMPADSWSSPSN